MSSARNRLFLDYDSGKGWLLRTPPLWDTLIDLIRMEAKRLARMFPLGDVAVIKRSDNGWHLKFPQASLTQEEMESVMSASLSHFGHKWFTVTVKDATLRVGKKRRKHSHPPYLKEVMYVGSI